MSKAIQHKSFSSDLSVIDGERSVQALISTISVDRDGEVLVSQGMDATDFNKNPVVMLMHEYYGLPIGKVVGVSRNASSVSAKIQFAERPAAHPADEEWIPDTVFALYQQGCMNAFSVGFLPIETRAATDADLLKYGANCRRVYSKWKLLELSAVPIPANQDAVALAVSKSMTAAKLFEKKDASDIEVTDEGDGGQDVTDMTDNAPPVPESMCSMCGKKFPDTEITTNANGAKVCTGCKGIMATDQTDSPAIPAPEETAKAAPPIFGKRLVFVVHPDPDTSVIEATAKRATNAAVAKAVGRIYII